MGKPIVEGARRADMHRIPIDQLVIDHSFNSRRFPHPPAVIRQYAQDMAKHGQITPGTVRKVDGKLIVTAGHGRAEAVKLVNSDPTLLEIYRQNFKEDFMPFDCLHEALEEADAFIANIRENNLRQDTSAIDDAFAQQRLRETYGNTDEQIAEIYGCSVADVWRNKKLLQLNEKEQKLVHEGKLPVSVAIHMVELSVEERGQIVADAVTNKGEKVDTSKVKEKVREKRQAEGRGLGMTTAELRKQFKAIIESEKEDDAWKSLAADFIETLSGKKGFKALRNAIERFAETKQLA